MAAPVVAVSREVVEEVLSGQVLAVREPTAPAAAALPRPVEEVESRAALLVEMETAPSAQAAVALHLIERSGPMETAPLTRLTEVRSVSAISEVVDDQATNAKDWAFEIRTPRLPG
jgi:hypothetical protein